MSEPTTPAASAAPARTTPREAEILSLLSLRLSNAAIAERLVVSRRTVESHVAALLRKFGAANRRQLVELACGLDRSEPDTDDRVEGRPSRPGFVGREAELHLLEGELARSRRDGSRTVLVLGEPGGGKSRLLQEFAARADARALTARAFPFGATTALSVWIDAVDGFLAGVHPDQVRKLSGPFLDDVVAACPLVAETFGGNRSPGRSHRRLVDAITGILRRASAEKPLIVTIDDVHLADSSSWVAVERLADALADRPILIVLTARPLELLKHPVANEVLFRLNERGALRRHDLPPLTVDELRGLTEAALGQTPEAKLTGWLFARSAGNPLYAISILDQLVRDGGDLSEATLTAVPPNLVDRIRAQLGALNPQASALLEVLSVIGRAASLADLTAVTQTPTTELVAPLEALLGAGLVVEHGSMRDLSYDIAHPVIADVVYQSTSGIRCRTVHRSVGIYLREIGRRAESSRHFARWAGPGDVEAITALQEALRDAGKTEAHLEELAILGMLAEVLPTGDPRWMEVLEALSDDAQWVLNHRADLDVAPCVEAMKSIDEMLGGAGHRASSADLVRRGVVKLRLSSLYSYGTGDTETAEAVAREALAAFDEAGDVARSLIARVELTAHHYVRGDPAMLASAARGLLVDLRDPTHSRVAMHAAGWLAMGTYYTGDFAEAETWFRRSAEMAEAHTEHFHHAWSLAALATSHAMAGEFAAARAMLDVVIKENPYAAESIVHECACIVNWACGRFAEVIDHVETALAAAGGRLGKRRAFALSFGAMAAAELARSEDAARYLALADGAYADSDFMIHREFLRWARAVTAALADRPRSALPLIARASERVVQTQCLAYAGPVLLDAADLASEAGDPGRSREYAERLAVIGRSLGTDFHQGLILLAAAATDSGSSVPAGADEAAVVFAAAGAPQLAGRCYFRVGRHHLNKGEWHSARAALRQAADLFDACGSVARRRQVVALLTR